MAGTVKGRLDWGVQRSRDGHRKYSLLLLVETDDVLDGPNAVLNATGAPAIGSTWSFGNDTDPWAYATPEVTVENLVKNEKHTTWSSAYTFTTVPQQRCQNQSINNPLDEPPRLSGSFVKYQRDLLEDKDGEPILTSTFERVTGLVRDDNRPTVVVEITTASLGIDVFSPMIDTLNDAPLWGLPARTIKLSNVSWRRLLYGVCNFYYVRRMEFDVDFTTFDRTDVEDTGLREFDSEDTGVKMNGSKGSVEDTPANRADPTNYVHIKDNNDENVAEPRSLDGNGSVNTDPLGSGTGTGGGAKFIGVDTGAGDGIQIYTESNFLLLGIPSSL